MKSTTATPNRHVDGLAPIGLTPDAAERYPTASEIVEDLRRAEARLPDAGEAWDRLLKYAGENATEVVAWLKSA